MLSREPENLEENLEDIKEKISFESAESFVKSKEGKIEDFNQNPIILFVMIREAKGEISWAKYYRIYDDLNDTAILCSCPTSTDTKKDSDFENMMKQNENANGNRLGFCIVNWVRKHLSYDYITSLKIQYDYEVDGFLCLNLTGTGLKRKPKTKTTPPLPIKLPPAD